jgi:hypothetical protein
MGGGVLRPILCGLIFAFLLVSMLVGAVVWETITILLERRAIERLVRRTGTSTRVTPTDKTPPDPGLWDREIDG